ncbi:hypothetical protein NAL32_18450 [Chryseobacterium sp. Ch-15]|uniref:EpsG family protein n=1 Tax=Chryseobacterium muglaense TaxID=2893752 RepID=A0A9Q3UUT7_9FLAO|nr:hypothetical protein [Chryseobacterium muglaense]MBD3906652.1 hypothetical protein [Chryseobacterium muglaense]MCC9035539.1 hypothetical protein [Chryseobacterium muglaense]MCM2556371.1 hypothetical protein [Chryseobacterium muglaense]
MKKALYYFNSKIFIYLIIIATALFAIVFTYFHNIKSDGYILGDWLINYEDGGFKRRGLSGSFFFLLQDLSGFRLHYLVYGFQVIIISLFFYYYFKLIQYKEATFLYLSLLLSSVGFVGLFNCVDYVGKKEFIVFFLFTYFVYQLNQNTLSRIKEYLICFGLFLAMLFHEITLFFIPYFLIALYLTTQKIEYRRYLKYILAVFIPAIVIVVFGKEINEGQSLQILHSRGVILTNGIFFWHIDERQYIKDHLYEYLLYIFSFGFSAFHLWFYLKYQTRRKVLSIALVFAFLFSLPLFYLAIDWGRWMYIHMIFIIVLLALLLKDSESSLASEKLILNRKFWITFFIIITSLIYRVEMSGRGFTFEGFFYRTLIAPFELLNKMI